MTSGRVLGLAFVALALVGCAAELESEPLALTLTPPPQAERTGDPVLGRSLLLNNGTETAPYLSCGVPRTIVDTARLLGVDGFADAIKLPERERGNAELPYNFSYATPASGVPIVTANCLMCHASKLGDSLIIGLGNPNLDMARKGTTFGIPAWALDLLVLTLSASEQAELDRFSRIERAEAEVKRPDTLGLNSADVMFGLLAAHRDPQTLEWREQADPDAQLDFELVYTDVPAWWNLWRRDRMFFSGFGRSGHARIMMSASLLCVDNAAEAEAIDEYFPHIEAFIRSLRAPSYSDVAKRSIDPTRAAHGRELFVSTCTGCHGDAETDLPPRPTVGVEEVGTDPRYAIESSKLGNGAVAYYFNFFDRSWYGTYGDAGALVQNEFPVYSPPTLDGIWATAPYFHDGSVPTLDAVLDPRLRPKIFRRSFVPEEYDFERLGWPFEEVATKGDDVTVYDTTHDPNGNTGHAFAAYLSNDERRDLLEYLKTL